MDGALNADSSSSTTGKRLQEVGRRASTTSSSVAVHITSSRPGSCSALGTTRFEPSWMQMSRGTSTVGSELIFVMPPTSEADPLSPRNLGRLLAGMAIQPILAGVLGFVVFPLVEYASRLSTGSRATDSLDAAVAFSLGVAMVAFGVTPLGVLPIVA